MKYFTYNNKVKKKILTHKFRSCQHCSKRFFPNYAGQYACSQQCQSRFVEYKCAACYQTVVRPKVFGKGQFCSWECRQGRRAGKTVDRADIFEFYNNSCFLCEESIDLELRCPDPWAPTLDHVIPKSAGGKSDWTNLVPAHAICNHKKANVIDPILIKKLRERLGLDYF